MLEDISLFERIYRVIPEPTKMSAINIGEMPEYITFVWLGTWYKVTSDLKVYCDAKTPDACKVLLQHLLYEKYGEVKAIKKSPNLKTKGGLVAALEEQTHLPTYDKYIDYHNLLHNVSQGKVTKKWITSASKLLSKLMNKEYNQITTVEFIEFDLMCYDFTKNKVLGEYLTLLQTKVKQSLEKS